jgi:hypothetical protein
MRWINFFLLSDIETLLDMLTIHTSNNKYHKKLAHIFAYIDSPYLSTYPKGHSIIYFIYSKSTSYCYIGESADFMQRKQTELREAKNALQLNLKNNIHVLKRISCMNKIGYQKWNFLILRYLGITTKDIRLSHEKQMIQVIKPSLNTPRFRITTNLKHFKRKRITNQTPKGCAHKKKKLCETCATITWKNRKPALYTVTSTNKKLTSPRLQEALNNFPNGTLLSIRKQGKFLDTTNFRYILTNFGMSTIKNKDAPDVHLKQFINELKNGNDISFKLKIHSHQRTKTKATNLILSIVKTRNAWKRDLMKSNMDTLIFIWTCILQIKDQNKRANALKNLKTIISKRLNIDTLPSHHLKIMHTESFPLQALRPISAKIFEHIYADSGKNPVNY